jgi:5-methyltetrahydropteroyltriglutamate--homocysteine methyltransferase
MRVKAVGIAIGDGGRTVVTGIIAPRADQVGSLLRPVELQKAWGAVFAGQLDRADMVEIEDRAIIAALAGQLASGIDICTDGEFRRIIYLTGLVDAVEGFAPGQGPTLRWRADPGQQVPPEVENIAQAAVVDRLRPKRRIAAHEAAFLREHAPGPFKVTLPSPAHYTSGGYKDGVTDRFYPTRSDLAHHLSEILAEEAASLAREGVPYVQVDSPTYSIFWDPSHFTAVHQWGPNPDALLAEMIACDNAVLDAARGGGALTAVHMCRGNASGAWLASGGYEPHAEKLFAELRCDRLLLEYDSDRTGGFEPLRLVPDDKTVVLGLVSTKRGTLESRDDVLRRIEEAARFVPVERLALSPQCGFASTFRGNPISQDEQWAKLALVASVAREVWG